MSEPQNANKKKKKGRPFSWRDKKKRKENKIGEDASKPKAKNFRRDNRDELENQVPHEGSYANPEMKSIALLTPLPEGYSNPLVEQARDENSTLIDEQATNGDDNSVSSQKAPKRKVAILMGFVGSNYAGMQMNFNQRTIQAELEQALYRAGCIAKSNYGFPNKYSWSNSARTDKGVHSCAQVCSGKILMIDEDYDVVREEVNRFLPEDIRVLDIVKTNRKFIAKTARDRARYMYMLPSFILVDREPLRKMFEEKQCHLNQRHASDPLSNEEVVAMQPLLSSYRVPSEKLALLRTALKRFEGTNRYRKYSVEILDLHFIYLTSLFYSDNYTRGKSSKDMASQRYIMSFEALDPVVDEYGIEWIPTQVIGQSFLLNQIRKMICMASEVARGAATMEIMDLSLSRDAKIQTAIAPAQGLFLDMSYFDVYNKNRLPDGEKPILWYDVGDESNMAAHRIQNFKEKVLMKHIMKEEQLEGNFIKYLFVQEFKFDRETAYVPDVESDNVSGDNYSEEEE